MYGGRCPCVRIRAAFAGPVGSCPFPFVFFSLIPCGRCRQISGARRSWVSHTFPTNLASLSARGTECGNLAVNRKLNPTVEYKLLPYGDMPSNCGELVVKTGAAMFSCYYKACQPGGVCRICQLGYQDTARTAASFTEDGFYKIGDIVRIEEDQRLAQI